MIDLCTPPADALITLDGLDTPVGPGSTITAVAIVNSLKVRIAELLVERGAMPPVITRASVVGHRALPGPLRRGLSGARATPRACHHLRGECFPWTTGGVTDRGMWHPPFARH